MKKKIFMLIVIIMIMVAVMPSVAAVDVQGGCKTILPNANIDVKIANTVHTIIVVIQIAVPVLLVVFGMMDLVKAVMGQKEDEIKKGQQTLVKRIIAAAIVFFVMVAVRFVVSLVDDNGVMDCADCFLNGVDKSSGECKK